MYPISLDLSKIRITLVGSGPAFERRLVQLKEHGATQVTIFRDALPESHEIKQANVLMVVGLDDETSAVLASIAKLQGVLVNVEDKTDHCDFHFVSFIKRGDLTLSVSTNGASPTLGQEIRQFLANSFDEGWATIVETLRKKRLEWKAQGLSNIDIGNKTRDYIKAEALLEQHAPQKITATPHHIATHEKVTELLS